MVVGGRGARERGEECGGGIWIKPSVVNIEGIGLWKGNQPTVCLLNNAGAIKAKKEEVATCGYFFLFLN